MKHKKEYNALNDDELKVIDDKIRTGVIAGDLGGQDIALHFVSLANSAFTSGRQVFVDILSNWIFEPPKNEPLHSAWALYSLLRTGFWKTAESAIFKLLDSDNGPQVLDLLVIGNRIAPDMTLMELPLPQDSSKSWREFVTKQRPWIPSDEQTAKMKEIFARYLAQLLADSGGGWDTIASGKRHLSPSIGNTVLDALELKPGMFGFRVDLKKLGKLWKSK